MESGRVCRQFLQMYLGRGESRDNVRIAFIVCDGLGGYCVEVRVFKAIYIFLIRGSCDVSLLGSGKLSASAEASPFILLSALLIKLYIV